MRPQDVGKYFLKLEFILLGDAEEETSQCGCVVVCKVLSLSLPLLVLPVNCSSPESKPGYVFHRLTLCWFIPRGE